ncbi:MAG: hypothetical protein H3C68_07670 [Deltaproteobacteria bacterium]|nr:hypothetical protein [Deltaproteobacteria bacterium]MBZ0220574.1 hypothetical protein [Deltaproteobacteria bacterium]
MRDTEKIFVIRIYRQDRKNPSEAVGIIEDSLRGKKRVFRTLDELVSILSGKRVKGVRKAKDIP